MAGKLPIILLAAAEGDVLQTMSEAIPRDRFAPLAARSWASVSESLGEIPIAGAIVHYRLEDADAMRFCAGLRELKTPDLPIVLLLPEVGRHARPGEPFDVAIKFPLPPGILLDNLLRVMAKHDTRLNNAITNLAAEVAWRAGDIEEKTYYEILEVTSSARHDEVVAAYDRFSLRFHPDRLRLLPDDDATKQAAATFYVFVTEAYQVLTNGRKRKAYDAGLRKGKFRFDESQLHEKRKSLPELASSPNAKRYLRLAEQQLGASQEESAIMMIDMALGIEPNNLELRRYKEKLKRKS